MIVDIVRALAGLRGAVRIIHATGDSYTKVEYTSTDAMQAMLSVGNHRNSPAPSLRRGNESPTAKYLLLPTQEQQTATYQRIMDAAEADAERIREHGSWAGAWS